MESDWANLDALALCMVLDKLKERIDHVYFGVVCKSWHSVAKLHHQNQQFRTNVLPMLMIPNKKKGRANRCLYGIPNGRAYPFQLSLPYNKRCCGFSHGWLATIDSRHVITLLNPFKKVPPIRLPPLDMDFPQCSVYKVTLSADPITNPNDYVVVAIYSLNCCLSFIRAGQKFWTYVDNDYFGVTDVTFYRGLVYAVNQWENIVSFNLSYSDDPFGKEQIFPNNVLQGRYDETFSQMSYLVKSLEGDLWMVTRSFATDLGDDNNTYNKGTNSFKVYKLELDLQSGRLLQELRLKSLGDNVLFLGDNDSISVSASYFSNSLQRDSIYFTHDYNAETPIPYTPRSFDLGIYNVKDESFDYHYLYNPSFTRMPPAFWVLPSFQWD
ncbi:hypothetical protein SESBI_40614 [Sesbania bispinosa]|nr:hypothetical protein SESBI_40614 [Sesbania bispinosa]